MRHARQLATVLVLLTLTLVMSSCQKSAQRVYTVGELTYALSGGKGNTMTYRSTSSDSTIIVALEPDPNRELRASCYRITLDGKEYLLSGDYRQVELTFPDGRTARQAYHGNSSAGYSGLGAHFSFEEWDLVDDFRNMLYPEPEQTSRSAGSLLIGLLLVGSGVFSVTNPRAAWFLNRGWMYRNAEPSDLYLGLSRVGGIIAVIVGLFATVGGIG